MRRKYEVSVNDMTIEEARAYLGTWLYEGALIEHYQFRGFQEKAELIGELTQRAYQLLGDCEYKQIYDETVAPYKP